MWAASRPCVPPAPALLSREGAPVAPPPPRWMSICRALCTPSMPLGLIPPMCHYSALPARPSGRVEFEPEDTVKVLPLCRHYYHPECITEWLKRNKVSGALQRESCGGMGRFSGRLWWDRGLQREAMLVQGAAAVRQRLCTCEQCPAFEVQFCWAWIGLPGTFSQPACPPAHRCFYACLATMLFPCPSALQVCCICTKEVLEEGKKGACVAAGAAADMSSGDGAVLGERRQR